MTEEIKMGIKKTVPIRGTKQDWYGNKEQEILKQNKDYAKTSIKNNLMGSPNFEEFSSFLLKSDKKKMSKVGRATSHKRPRG